MAHSNTFSPLISEIVFESHRIDKLLKFSRMKRFLEKGRASRFCHQLNKSK